MDCFRPTLPRNRRMKRHATPIVFLDFETTGGVAAQDRIIEIALVRVQDGKETAWETLVSPADKPVPAIVSTLTGLTASSLAGSPEFADVTDTLADFVRGATVVAHNAPFEREFMKAEFARLGRTVPPADYLCTRRLAGCFYPELPKHSMDVVADHAGLRVNGRRHRAMPDVRLTLELWNLWRATIPRLAFEAAIRDSFV